MLTSEFVAYLKSLLPNTKIYNGLINGNDSECMGVFTRSGPPEVMAIGGPDNNSYGVKSLSILIHWTENSDKCERKALEVYKLLRGKTNFTIGSKRVSNIQMLDPGPIDISRDKNNICEMVIRLNIYHDR